jgi:signal-transduction protein with cAMP-binding, CBS, and nucleotidyltransferase domain
MDRSRLSRFINQALQELPLEDPAFVSPNSSIYDAITHMREGSRSCVLVRDGSTITGIFTERDVLNRCMSPDFDWGQPLSAAVMTPNPRTIDGARPVGEAVATMQQFHYRTLPVTRDGDVVGIARLGDLVTQLAEAYPEDVLNLPPRPNQVMEKQEGG